MEVRLLTGGDAAEFSRVRLEALESEPEAFSSSPESHRALGLDEVKARLSAGPAGNFVVGAFLDSVLIGVAGFFRDQGLKQRHRGHVWGVYVSPGARGKGAGRKLMTALLGRAAEIGGVEQVVLSVTATQTAAIELYRSVGFRSFGLEPRGLKVDGRYLDTEYMALTL